MHTNHTYYLQPITILVHNDKFHEFSPRGGFFIGNLNDMHGWLRSKDPYKWEFYKEKNTMYMY